MREITLEESKKIQVELLQTVHDYCEAHGLTYYLMFGTLIGAIRHQGFIPWDDDIDICMPREDYDRFFEAFGQRGNAMAVDCNNASDYYLPFGKVIDARTVLKENIVSNAEIGVYIDIFAMDRVSGKGWLEKLQIKRLLLLRDLLSLNLLPGSDRRKGYRKIAHRVLSKVFSGLNMNSISRKLDACARRITEKTGENGEIRVLCDVNKTGMLFQYSRSDFDGRLLMPFEGNEYYAPKGYDHILSSFYGNYMQFPPEEERITHHEYVQYWKE